MDELLQYGTPGVIAYGLYLFGRLIAPALRQYLPAWTSARNQREDLLMEALRSATAVMTETVSVLQSLRREVVMVRTDQTELRSDVEHIATQLDLPRPRRRRAARAPREQLPTEDQHERT